MEGMKAFPDKFFDLAIVDPPYGKKGLVQQSRYHANALTVYKRNTWDKTPPGADYFKELFRVSKHQIIWGGNYFTPHLPPAKNWIVWDKCQPLGISLSMHELAFCSQEGQAVILRISCASGKNNISNAQLAQNYLRIHPTQKPVALYSECLRLFAKPGQRILDTHLGSGSSRIAAYKRGFDFWGFEIDKEYFEKAEVRFQKEIALPLFDGNGND